MSQQATETTATGAAADAPVQGDGQQQAAKPQPPTFEPITSQADLDRVLGQRLQREREKFADYSDLQEKAKRLDEIEQASASELEKAVRKAREEASAEVRAQVTADRVLDKIEVAAAGKFADVTDARLRLGARAAEFVDSDGRIDAEAIAAAVEKELESAPHLKAAAASPQRPRPDRAQGAGTGVVSASTVRGRDRYAEKRGTKN